MLHQISSHNNYSYSEFLSEHAINIFNRVSATILDGIYTFLKLCIKLGFGDALSRKVIYLWKL